MLAFPFQNKKGESSKNLQTKLFTTDKLPPSNGTAYMPLLQTKSETFYQFLLGWSRYDKQ